MNTLHSTFTPGNIFKELLDIFLPMLCLGCQTASNEPYCQSCIPYIRKLQNPYCAACSEPFLSETTDSLCHQCKEVSPPFEKVFSFFLYGGLLQETITRWKFTPSLGLSSQIQKLLEAEIITIRNELSKLDAIVPVPMHRKSFMKRGFHQTYMLAKTTSKQLKIPLVLALKKKFFTVSQSGLTSKKRKQNLFQSFSLSSKNGKNIQQKHIGLIDDVFTTGATARECSRLLLFEGNARSVTVLTLARTPKILSDFNQQSKHKSESRM